MQSRARHSTRRTGDAPTGEDGQPLSGTELTFLASGKTFSSIEYDFATLEHRFRELAFLNSGVALTLTDARSVDAKVVDMNYEGERQKLDRKHLLRVILTYHS